MKEATSRKLQTLITVICVDFEKIISWLESNKILGLMEDLIQEKEFIKTTFNSIMEEEDK